MGIKLPEFIRNAKISLNGKENEEMVQIVNPGFQKSVLVDSSLLLLAILNSNPDLAKKVFEASPDVEVLLNVVYLLMITDCLQDCKAVAAQVGQALLDKVKCYQPNTKLLCFFFKGKNLDGRGKTGAQISAANNRERTVGKAIKGIYLGRFNAFCPDMKSAKKRLALNMGRPNWWFSVMVSDFLKGITLQFVHESN